MNTVKVRNLELGNGIPAICIPNVGKTKEDILSLTHTYLGMHMDLMEWRMDWYEDVEDIAKVTELVKELRDVMGDTPLLCTFRTDKEGGAHPMSTEKYAELNKAVAATGNADIITLALNLFSLGIDPGLCFDNIESIVNKYEAITHMDVHPRQPYAGELVYTAFSGSHQDAIKKGMDYCAKHKSAHWENPYIPIDPADTPSSICIIVQFAATVIS